MPATRFQLFEVTLCSLSDKKTWRVGSERMLETISQGLIPNSYIIWPVGRKQVAGRHVQYHNGENKVESKTKSISGRTAMATLARCLYVVQRKVDGSKRSDEFYRALRGRGDSMLSLAKGSRTSPGFHISNVLGTFPPPQSPG
jgi:hypothetical protein